MSVRLALAIHSHQPLGNFDHVIERAYRLAYWPFLKTLGRFPWFRVSMHTSGPLLLWIEKHHPEYFRFLRNLVRRGQVELLTSGFYEPILITIPEADRQVQIRKMTDYLQRRLGAKAIGAWMTERVWEPELAGTLGRAGVRYALLDDTHFIRAGVEPEQLTGPYLTDDGRDLLTLFPTHRHLRYRIPYAPPRETVEYLRSFQKVPNALIGYGDDGEKFGIWPGTDVLCWKRKWVERFIRSLRLARDIEVMTFGEAQKRFEPLGRVYPPTSSYEEMSEWTLPPPAGKAYLLFHEELQKRKQLERHRRFIHGGHFRGFFAKYEEANWLQKRMLNVREEILAAERQTRRSFPSAWEEVFRSQGNDAYWHGAFGGLYSTHLRHLAYSHLIRSEAKVARAAHRKPIWVDATVSDIDLDGHPEVSLENERLKVIVAPHRGGMVLELDVRSRQMNLLNTLRRREETYYDQLRKLLLRRPRKGRRIRSIHELWNPTIEATDDDLVADRFPRGSFADHLLNPRTTMESFAKAKNRESPFLPTLPYAFSIERHRPNEATLILKRPIERGRERFLLTKRMTLHAGSQRLEVRYELRNAGRKPLSVWFGTELVFTLLAADEQRAIILDQDGFRRSLRDVAAHEGVFDIAAQADDLGIRTSWKFSQPFSLWRFPIEAVSMSESGFEKHYQGSVLFVHRPLTILPRRSWRFSIEQTVSTLK